MSLVQSHDLTCIRLQKIIADDWAILPDYSAIKHGAYRMFPRSDNMPSDINRLYIEMAERVRWRPSSYGDKLYLYEPQPIKGTRRLGPLSDTNFPREFEKYANLAALTRQYCKAALLHYRIKPLAAQYAALWLYLEELHTGRKTMPDNRHILTLEEAAKMPAKVFYRLTPYFASKVNGINTPKRAKELYREFTHELLADIDWQNVYVTGSCIDYCCAKRNDNDWRKAFEKSDIDVFIDCSADDFDERAENIITAIRNRSKVECAVETIQMNTAVKYKVHAERTIEIFRSQFGAPVGYHVPNVRGWCQAGEFRITVSAALTYRTGVIPEYRWVKADRYVIEVIVKNARRGYAFYCSEFEYEVLENYVESNNLQSLTTPHPRKNLKWITPHYTDNVIVKGHIVPPRTKLIESLIRHSEKMFFLENV